jgi:Domain of unknown function (DUF1905)/Bacteriocin-protection, YdeI or OmpD-Associated
LGILVAGLCISRRSHPEGVWGKTMQSQRNQVIRFTTTILKFGQQGEKTGWTYIEIPAKIASRLSAGNKKSFRVKGWLDTHPISGVALLPMGEGNFIMPLKADLRKLIRKQKGATLDVRLEVDKKPISLSKELMDCLRDEPEANTFFNSLPPSHRQYYSKWIEAAKTEETKTKRLALTLNGLSKRQHYGQMIRSITQTRIDRGL